MQTTCRQPRSFARSLVGSLALLVAFTATLNGCSNEANELQVRIASQQQRLSRAAASRDSAVSRLGELRDSLHVKVQQNIALGMPQEKAEAIEQALLNSQKALVNAEEKNLKLQEEYLELLRASLRAVRDGG